MPLTKSQAKKKRAMTQHYGKKKGEQVFYASEAKAKAGHMRKRRSGRSAKKGR